MPALADTTIRLLGQEPLAGRLPTAEQLRIAAILDRAGYAYLEVSGGGCFDSAVRRGVESPWERIRALRAQVKTPLGLALRGRFLVGSRPVDNDFIRRFIACAAENGIDVFRLHDPLNDVSNLREAADAVARAGGELEAGLVYSPGRSGATDPLMAQGRGPAATSAWRTSARPEAWLPNNPVENRCPRLPRASRCAAPGTTCRRGWPLRWTPTRGLRLQARGTRRRSPSSSGFSPRSAG